MEISSPRWWHGVAAATIAASWLTVALILAYRVVTGDGLDRDMVESMVVPLHLVRMGAGLMLVWRGTPAALSIVVIELLAFVAWLGGDYEEITLIVCIPMGTVVMTWWSFRESRWVPSLAGLLACVVAAGALFVGEILDNRSFARILLLGGIVLGWMVQVEFALWPLRAWGQARREADAEGGAVPPSDAR